MKNTSNIYNTTATINLHLQTQSSSARTQAGRFQQIRREIAEGTYLTEEKLSIAIDRLCEDLNPPSLSRPPHRAAG